MSIFGGRYALGRQIGMGGMGTVYLGTDIKTEEYVALKKLHRDNIAAYPELVERFTREAEALRALNHPNIVKSFGHFEQDGDWYIVMEYIAGKDLADLLINEGRLPLKRAIEIALGITDALTRAHHLRITHRDIKPANVLLDLDGIPRLTDFGVAHWENKARVTAADIQIGTPAYMSPEMFNGASGGDPHSDLWALGVILYEMVAGKHPFYDGKSLNTMLVNVLVNPVPDIQLARPDCPEALADLIYRLLGKTPVERIGSARLVGAELEIIGQMLDTRELRRTANVSRFSPEPAQPDLFRHNLPVQPTPLIGRDDDMREVLRLLESPHTRLITLVGSGGIGKTRLALGVAQDITSAIVTNSVPPHFEHGIFLVELAPLLSVEPLIPTIANVLGFQFAAEGDPKDQLLDYLREKHLLLIVDNFEHILDGAPLIAEILQVAAGVKILATSRERLNLLGETVYTLGGLDVPEADATAEAMQSSAAVQLFIQNAKRAHPAWAAAQDDYLHIAGICRQVGGLPLGIVLAAAWVQALSAAEILAELGRSLDLLEADTRDVPERHRSMRAVFEYSWQMMPADERALLMNLSVFRGGFSRRAGQAVADAGLRQLAALISKSLLRRDPDAGKYYMHELLRQYVDAKLIESGTSDKAHAAHSDYFIRTLAEIQRSLEGAAQIDTLRAIDGDIENIRAACAYGAVSGDLANLERGLPTISLYFEMRGQYTEGLVFYEQIIALLRARESSAAGRDRVLGHVLARAAALATALHHFETVDVLLTESLALIGTVDGGAAHAMLEFAQGYNHLNLKRAVDGRPHFEKAAALYRAANERWALARTLGEWSSCYWYRADGGNSDFALAKTLASEGLAIQRALGDTYGMAHTFLRLGTIASYAGDDAGDAENTSESLSLFERVGHLYGMADALNNIGVREMMIGDYAASRVHLEKSLRIKRQIGTVVPVVWAQFVLARLSYNEAKFEESLRRAEDGLQMVAGSTHREWELTLQFTRAQALLAFGRYSEAIAAFDRALEIAAELGNAEDEIFGLNRKGLALLLAGDFDASRACLERAIISAEAANDVTVSAVSKMLLARGALNNGDLEAARTLHAPAAAYFADKENWAVSYTNDEWDLATWAAEAMMISAQIAYMEKSPQAPALLLAAFDAVERTFSPAHVCKVVVFAAYFLADTHPDVAARLASAAANDARTYFSDRAWAGTILARLNVSEIAAGSVEAMRITARQALV